MVQMNKKFQDAEKPKWHLQIDPFTRYEPLVRQLDNRYKGARVGECDHPVVKRFTALMNSRSGGANPFCAKALVAVGGKAVPTSNAQDYVERPNGKLQESSQADAQRPVPTPIPQNEVIDAAASKASNLNSMLEQFIDARLTKTNASSQSAAFDDKRWKALPVDENITGFAELAKKEWDVMTEKHLSPVQRAELHHIRNMKATLQHQISRLKSSLEAFEKAEMEMLMMANP